MFKCNDESEESSLLQTIRIPKNLLFLTDKLPQPNYEKKITKKNNNNSNSFSDEIKESLPDIKINQNKNHIRKRSEKKYDKDIRDSDKKDNSEEKRNNDRNSLLINYMPTNDESNGNLKLNNEQIIIPKKKRRIDNNDRSLDNIISHNIYSNALNGSGIGSNNNIKILKSENYEINNNNSLIRDKSPYEDSPYIRKKSKDIMMLPNIRHQQKYENK